MQCPRCQQEKPPQARFCLGCGARLARLDPQALETLAAITRRRFPVTLDSPDLRTARALLEGRP